MLGGNSEQEREERNLENIKQMRSFTGRDEPTALGLLGLEAVSYLWYVSKKASLISSRKVKDL